MDETDIFCKHYFQDNCPDALKFNVTQAWISWITQNEGMIVYEPERN